MYFSARRGPFAPILALTLGVGILMTVALPDVMASADTVTGTSVVLKQVKAAITAQSSAHVESLATSNSGAETEKIEADVAAKSGSESIVDGKENLLVRVTSSDAYVRGNSSGLEKIFGLTAAEAKKAGQSWMMWKSGSTGYSNLKGDVTMASVTDLLPEASGTTLSTAAVGGTKRYLLAWTVAATSSEPQLSVKLSVSAAKPNLPVEADESTTTGLKVAIKVSKWGESVKVSAPGAGSTIAFSKVTG
jgi:hypothetical protein